MLAQALETLKPSFTLEALYPPGTVLAIRTQMDRMLFALAPDEEFRLDSASGVMLPIVGNMPLICHENTATPDIQAFMRLAGLEPGANILSYTTESEATALAHAHLTKGRPVAYIYPLPTAISLHPGLLVTDQLYGWLNDKCNLNHLVDSKHLPPHALINPEETSRVGSLFPGSPIFMKACHAGASGAGYDIHHCPDKESRASAIQWMLKYAANLTAIRVEMALEIATCWCVNVAIHAAGCQYLGAAAQIFSSPGKQMGSRIDPNDLPDEEIINLALNIGEQARMMGYRGVAGFDIGVDRMGYCYVFDLNFRLVASTPQTLLHDAAVRRCRCSISESWGITTKKPLHHAMQALRQFVETCHFIPIRLYESTMLSKGTSVISGFIVGNNLQELHALSSEMFATIQDRSD